MSTVEPGRTTAPPAASREYSYEDERGDGWVLFAAIILGLLGVLNVIDGVAAVADSRFFTDNATYILANLNTWGWVLICVGVLQALTALGVRARVTGVRWLGVAIAFINAIVQLMFIDAYPFWSLALFSLDILVIYALVAYGARRL
jgi:hypothetical protein